MIRYDWKLGAVLLIACFACFTMVDTALVLRGALTEPIKTPDEPITLTQELIDGPIPLAISCKEQRGAYHKLICGVNGDVKGRWLVRERVEGELRRGSESVFAFNEWEMAVGSDVSPTILIQFIPTGLQQGISLEYRLDTAYMRKGVQNFAGVNI